jgi:hypothetical protein
VNEVIDQAIDALVTILLLAGIYGFYAAQAAFLVFAAWAFLRIGFSDP